jgi:hypothetical protein
MDRTLEFDPTLKRVVYVIAQSMLYTLILSVVCTSGMFGFLCFLRKVLKSEDTDMSSLSRNHMACTVTVVFCAGSLGFLYSIATWKSLLPHQRRQPMTILRMLASTWTAPLLSVAVAVILLENSQRTFSGYYVGGLVIVMGTLLGFHVNLEAINRYRQDTVVSASRAALAIAREASDSKTTSAITETLALQPQKKSRLCYNLSRVWKVNLSGFLTYVVAFVYVFGIFRLFNAAKTTTGGSDAVLLLALLVKVGGNKLQIQLLRNNPKMALWTSNISVFTYEYLSALLVRLMLLSMPNERTAIYLALFNAFVELMSRTWFFVCYISFGAKQLAGLSFNEPKFHETFLRRGQLRAIDSCNTSMVEYMTMVAAAAVLGTLPDTGAFNLPSEEMLELGSLLRVLGVQIGTEFMVDTFVIGLEAKGGMSALQLQYWNNMSRGQIMMQFFYVLASTSFVLGFLVVGH